MYEYDKIYDDISSNNKLKNVKSETKNNIKYIYNIIAASEERNAMQELIKGRSEIKKQQKEGNEDNQSRFVTKG